MREFTREELRTYTGKDGTPALIAFNGMVYDVSGSFLWRGGVHQVMHPAGVDLTDELDQAPHGAGLLEKFPVVGTLAED